MDSAWVSEQDWDAVIVGTGMGGAVLGHALARAGWRVLFIEKGRAQVGSSSRLRGDYAEMLAPVGVDQRQSLLDSGRFADEIHDVSTGRERRFVPFIGCGAGGSTALYGMVLERLFPADFEPAAHHSNADGSTLPAHWPVTFDAFEPYYAIAERLFGVTGGGDPLRPPGVSGAKQAAPPFSAAAGAIASHFAERGLHPYRLPLACAFVQGCRSCQGYLCDRDCKRDAGSVALAPAVERFHAHLLDECEVTEVEASAHSVTGLVCRRAGRVFRVNGRHIVLAAGALATPALLLASRSTHWPDGVANANGLVGRNLMRHYVDIYAVFTRGRSAADDNAKELGCNDFYLSREGKFGSIQSFGRLPPARMIVDDLQRDLGRTLHPALAAAMSPFKPLMRAVIERVFDRATMLASVMEDLPFADNRVLPAPGGKGGIAISYRVRAGEAARIEHWRKRIAVLLAPHRFKQIRQAENNERIAHACGTCRFGDDPRTSVLDAHNRAHGLDNLYVVDASFFPSSGGTNPALTVAANALRVAEHLTGISPASGGTT